MMNNVLLKPKKENSEHAQRNALFKTMCKVKGKCCNMVINSGSTNNIVPMEMVERMSLKKVKHPVPYKVS